MAMLESLAGNAAAEMDAIVKMKRRYLNAETNARATNSAELYYPALNRMAAELIVEANAPDWPGFDAGGVKEVRDSLIAKTRDDPDFWSVVGVTDLRLYEALAKRQLASELESIVAEYVGLYERVSAPSMWGSVYDQARWVVPRYMSRVGDEEDKAALVLLERLSQLASSG